MFRSVNTHGNDPPLGLGVTFPSAIPKRTGGGYEARVSQPENAVTFHTAQALNPILGRPGSCDIRAVHSLLVVGVFGVLTGSGGESSRS